MSTLGSVAAAKFANFVVFVQEHVILSSSENAYLESVSALDGAGVLSWIHENLLEYSDAITNRDASAMGDILPKGIFEQLDVAEDIVVDKMWRYLEFFISLWE